MKTCHHCGGDLDQRPGKPRSIEQNRRYHAMITAAFHHWPEPKEGERRFANREELRKHLQMRAGHREVAVHMPLDGMSPEQALMVARASIEATGEYAFPVIFDGALIVFKPKSVAFEKLKHADACKLFDDVADLIEQAIGVTADKLLKESEKVA
jgi:alpha-N-acetylglucosamine transferase